MPGVSSPFLEIFGDIMVPFLWWCWKPQPQHSRQLGPDDFRITVTPCDWESPWLTNVDLTGVNKKQTITRALGGTTISWMCKECVSHTHTLIIIIYIYIYIYYITYIFFWFGTGAMTMTPMPYKNVSWSPQVTWSWRQLWGHSPIFKQTQLSMFSTHFHLKIESDSTHFHLFGGSS